MIVLAPDEKFAGAKLNRIGIDGYNLYVAPSRSKFIEIWKCNCLIPNSWVNIIKIPFNEIIYKVYALDKVNEIIYYFGIVIPDGEEYPMILLLKIDATSCNVYERIYLDPDSGNEFENNVFLTNISIICCEGSLYMYDGSIVKGDIPYWELSFTNHNTFNIIPKTIIDRMKEEHNEMLTTRFPVIINAKERKVMRFTNTSTVLIYNYMIEDWDPYTISFNNDLDPSLIDNKGLKESYGSMGHRARAIESKLQLISDGSYVIANVLNNHKYHFYELYIDEKNKEYSFRLLRTFKWTDNYFKMFYPTLSRNMLVFISDISLTVIPLKPLTLRESMFWQYQTLHCKINKENAYIGGKSEEEIIKIIGCKGIKRLL
uniref:FBA_3 domain-containing protein n=1 Tax=Parastrongyloides trichosuri TaxID=131310 RepID=A0A0N4ZMX7_PARTI